MVSANPSRLERVLSSPKSAGTAMFGAMLLAFVWVNSPYQSFYEVIHHAPMSVQIGALVIAKPMISWINEGLMVFFFFLIGLEIKREVYEGQLSSLRQVALPAIAAIGGMAIPAAIYLAFNVNDPIAAKGWAIPAATDIVLALAFLALLGPRVPIALKVFLTALAIFDDFGTLVIIAAFYSGELSAFAMMLALAGIAAAMLLNRMRVTQTAAYLLVGVLLWVTLLKSGVHATLAGVALAFCIPMRVDGKEILKQIEHDLSPWVGFGVVPVFAFFNAGIELGGSAIASLLEPISLGVVLGLFLGKQLGVFASARAAVWMGLASLPPGVSWWQLYGVSLLAGVGFTMSLFIAALAFNEPGAILTTNLSIVVGSLLSGAAGMMVLHLACQKIDPNTDDRSVAVGNQT
ncbi:MAG TPA: Na+/H+ antiporter NhaA [Woeseiaceae bacterium]|nr:Na+/H+ antiporter NhaA [Woeseiaceae bacterium]